MTLDVRYIQPYTNRKLYGPLTSHMGLYLNLSVIVSVNSHDLFDVVLQNN